jgi:hypothetical protein
VIQATIALVANQKSFNQLKRNKAGVCNFANTRFSFGPDWRVDHFQSRICSLL